MKYFKVKLDLQIEEQIKKYIKILKGFNSSKNSRNNLKYSKNKINL